MENQIRVVRRQQIDGYSNQTLIFLPSFAKAWEIFEGKMLQTEGNPLEQAQKDGLAISWDKHVSLDSDSLASRQQTCNNIWKEITHGPNADFLQMIESVSHALIEVANEIDPSLKPNYTWKQMEEGPVFDAGMIAAEEERPCFSMEQPTSVYRKGDGQAFKLLINTDTSYGHSDSENCIATVSLVRCLLHFGEVELWIQQGWLGSSAKSGVTLFPIHRGQEITPSMTWFWLASGYRDSPFSRVINSALGRGGSGCSEAPQMEHDIYIANAIGSMPNLPYVPQMASALKSGKKLTEDQQKGLHELAKWLANMVRKTVYTDEAIEKLETITL